ncbi:MAG: carboxymuconolactone decarboxylase family protein [Verrucomicrobia bacterium]|nr:carboxymuconolactone decarboxylase family protein [Verrucomicrobiota bacterium]
MARIPAKPLSKYPWYLRILLKAQKKKYGDYSEPVLLWGRSPRAFLGFMWMQKALNSKRARIKPDLRSMITIKVSQFNQCSFCIDMNSAQLLQRGGTQDKIDAISHFRESALFSAQEKAALEYVEAVMKNAHQVPDEVFQRLGTYFDEDAVVEMTALIGLQNLSSQFNAALDAAPMGFCQLFKK